MSDREPFLEEHLRFWKDSGIPAPRNELHSIQAWLRTIAGMKDIEEVKQVMRLRLVLLMEAANDLHDAGEAAIDEAGIYDNAPELKP